MPGEALFGDSLSERPRCRVTPLVPPVPLVPLVPSEVRESAATGGAFLRRRGATRDLLFACPQAATTLRLSSGAFWKGRVVYEGPAQ